MMDFSVIVRNFDYLMLGPITEHIVGGLALTVLMAAVSCAIALIAGVLLAAVAWSYPGRVERVIFVSSDLIRGVPLILVIFWLYFLLPLLVGDALPPTFTVILALAWFSSAAVMFSTYAGLKALPRGQTEAAVAAGFSGIQTLRYVLLPQALHNLVPSYIGLLVALVKDTSLAFIVNVPELTTVASQVNNREQIYPTQIFLFLGAVYFVLCQGLSLAASRFTSSPARAAPR